MIDICFLKLRILFFWKHDNLLKFSGLLGLANEVLLLKRIGFKKIDNLLS